MKPKLKDAYILDDFNPFVTSLKRQLFACDEFEEVLSFSNEEDLIFALKSAKDYKVPYLFLELYLNQKTIVLNRIKAASPNAKVIVISSFTNPSTIEGLMKFKPHGIVHKADKPHDIIECIEKVSKGHSYFSGIIRQIIEEARKSKTKNVFTPKEKELLSFWARGYSVDKTASHLSLSFHTVVAHRRNMFKKANCKSLSELLIYAKKKNLIQ